MKRRLIALEKHNKKGKGRDAFMNVLNNRVKKNSMQLVPLHIN